MTDVTYVVVNENTLGYIYAEHPSFSFMEVLAGNVWRGGRDWKNGSTVVQHGIDTTRPATVEDFHAYRVSPAGHFD